MNTRVRFCPSCGASLGSGEIAGRERAYCVSDDCGYVYWNNPTPVVAAIAERDDHLVLVRSHGWPEHWFGLISGFLEAGEAPEDAVLREVTEEVGLAGRLEGFVGAYPFYRMNQLLLVYHVSLPPGMITLEESELAAYREIKIHKVRPWPNGTGPALQAWLRARGYDAEFLSA